MRERLTLAFVLLTILLLLGAGAVRSYVLRDLIREQEATHLRQEVELIGSIVDDRQAAGGVIDRAFLESLAGPTTRLEYDADGARPIAVDGPEYTGSADSDEDMSSTVVLDDATITVSRSSDVIKDIMGRDIGSIAALFLLIAVVARIPEARAISTALRTSAHQLEDRVHRERDFAEHASHVLRTPLTGLRLELEDLALRDDVPADVKESAARSVAAVDEVGAVAAELVELTRRGSLVEGSELPLVDLATQLAQRWADRLGVRNRTLTAAADGDLSLTYTPGPVEHVTDLLLADVVRRGAGAVRIVFHGEDGGHLRIRVESEGRSDDHSSNGSTPLDRIAQVSSVVEALGGRVAGVHAADGIEVLLPRR
jgi:hypothetical protein